MTPIFLREFEAKDVEDLFEMDSDPLVQKFLSGTRTREESENGLFKLIFHRSKMRYGTLAIMLQNKNKVIGYCGLQPLNGFGYELFFGLNSKYWGKGYARLAAKLILETSAPNLSPIYATVNPLNVRSQRVLESLGFHFDKNIFYEPRNMDHKLYVKRRASIVREVGKT